MPKLEEVEGKLQITFDQAESDHIIDQLEELGIALPLAKAKMEEFDVHEIDVNRNIMGFTSLKDIILNDPMNMF